MLRARPPREASKRSARERSARKRSPPARPAGSKRSARENARRASEGGYPLVPEQQHDGVRFALRRLRQTPGPLVFDGRELGMLTSDVYDSIGLG